MSTLTPGQEMLQQASAGPDFGDRPLDRLIAAAPLPIFDMTKHVAVTMSNKTGPLPSASLPGSERQGGEQDKDAAIIAQFESVLSIDPTAFLNDKEAVYQVTKSELLTFVSALQQPVPDGWISVNDRLPPTDPLPDGNTPSVLVKWKRGSLADNLIDICVSNTVYLAHNVANFTHWMPLPSAPEAAEAALEGSP